MHNSANYEGKLSKKTFVLQFHDGFNLFKKIRNWFLIISIFYFVIKFVLFFFERRSILSQSFFPRNEITFSNICLEIISSTMRQLSQLNHYANELVSNTTQWIVSQRKKTPTTRHHDSIIAFFLLNHLTGQGRSTLSPWQKKSNLL
jgi:hypothetical protein